MRHPRRKGVKIDVAQKRWRRRYKKQQAKPTYLSLSEILPHVNPPCDHDYSDFETQVITPQLLVAGYELFGHWYTGDGDSFGPLTRCINTDKGVVVYG